MHHLEVFSPSPQVVFSSVCDFLCCEKFVSLIWSHLFIFAFISIALGDIISMIYVLPVFSSGSFMLSCLMFKPLSHFEFIFVYGRLLRWLSGKEQEMWVQSLCQEDPLEEEMATHSVILAMERGAW